MISITLLRDLVLDFSTVFGEGLSPVTVMIVSCRAYKKIKNYKRE